MLSTTDAVQGFQPPLLVFLTLLFVYVDVTSIVTLFST